MRSSWRWFLWRFFTGIPGPPGKASSVIRRPRCLCTCLNRQGRRSHFGRRGRGQRSGSDCLRTPYDSYCTTLLDEFVHQADKGAKSDSMKETAFAASCCRDSSSVVGDLQGSHYEKRKRTRSGDVQSGVKHGIECLTEYRDNIKWRSGNSLISYRSRDVRIQYCTVLYSTDPYSIVGLYSTIRKKWPYLARAQPTLKIEPCLPSYLQQH